MNPDNNQPNQESNYGSTDHNADGIIQPTENIDGSKFFQPTIQPNFDQTQDNSASNQQSQATTPGQVYGAQPANNLNTNPSVEPPKPKPKLLLVTAVAAGVLLVITVAAVLLTSGGSKKPAQTTDDTSQNKSEGPQPASALDVEQSNNSINQDISTLSDQEEFPETQLDDKTLGL